MKFRISASMLTTVFALVSLSGVAAAFEDCPADHVIDDYTCTEMKGKGKTGGYFRTRIPSPSRPSWRPGSASRARFSAFQAAPGSTFR